MFERRLSIRDRFKGGSVWAQTRTHTHTHTRAQTGNPPSCVSDDGATITPDTRAQEDRPPGWDGWMGVLMYPNRVVMALPTTPRHATPRPFAANSQPAARTHSRVCVCVYACVCMRVCVYVCVCVRVGGEPV